MCGNVIDAFEYVAVIVASPLPNVYVFPSREPLPLKFHFTNEIVSTSSCKVPSPKSSVSDAGVGVPKSILVPVFCLTVEIEIEFLHVPPFGLIVNSIFDESSIIFIFSSYILSSFPTSFS